MHLGELQSFTSCSLHHTKYREDLFRSTSRLPLKFSSEECLFAQRALKFIAGQASVSPITSSEQQYRHTEWKARTWRTWALPRLHPGDRRPSVGSLQSAVRHAPIAGPDGS